MTSGFGERAPGATSLRTGLCGQVGLADIGRAVKLCGWVARRREHGEHLAFIDVRDHTGIIQCVVDGSVDVRSEYVVAVSGVVRRRPEGMENPHLATGEVEVGECTVEVLSAAEPPPFAVEDRVEVDEVVRLRHRYVDLRRPKMQENLRLRARVNAALRAALDHQDFCEVETPLLWAPTPEGAREFAVPSRLHRGAFYVLPQSPQLAKQLLMVAGMDRYYQIAHCMRDEDLRADRQFEFTQLDLEASFVSQTDVMAFVSEAVLDAAEVATGERPGPIEQMTWVEALDRFGTDKPDLRFGMELIDLSAVFEGTEVRAFAAPCVKAIVVPGAGDYARSRLDGLVERAKALGAKGLAWFKVTGVAPAALDSPLDRFLGDEERTALVETTGAASGDLVLVVADEHRLACGVLGQLRVDLGGRPVGEGPFRYVWVVEFPMFDGVDAAGAPVPAHHPFTMPHPEDLDLMEKDPAAVRSQAYDLVLNGWELGSGSVRIHRADIQSQVFSALGISEEEAASRFGFLTGAFRFGAPPHAGFGMGIDRLVAIFCGEENIREVIAFPKTQSGADPLTGAPKALAPSALAELGITVTPAPGRAGARLSAVAGDLFDAAAERRLRSRAPLAARLRPRNLDEVVGQRHLVAPGAPLRVLVEADRLGSAILWGPPGTGKTTLARLVADATAKEFVPLSAVASGVKDVREALEGARRRLGERGQGTILFVDEVHRFNKAQQDVLLPGVEEGLVVLVGATTENPFFEVNPPLMSRATLWRLEPLADEDLRTLVRRGLEVEGAQAEEEAVDALVAVAEGDARAALTTLEVAVALASARAEGAVNTVTRDDVARARDGRLYHQGADDHFDQVSALIKSVRGSDPDAGLYWLARMLEAGEDARFIARRLVILASEDVGMADPTALVVADAAGRAVEMVGLPEAALNLAQAVVHLACAPKSNRVTLALARARQDVASAAQGAVPAHLRDAHYRGAAEIGHGTGYRYPHDDPAGWVDQQYRPEGLEDHVYYEPSGHGAEAAVAERLAHRGDGPPGEGAPSPGASTRK